jgi:hypothetical protein
MVSLREKFSMKEMGLSISFRCPIAVVENARFRAPHMQYPTWAKQGLVKRLGAWDAQTIEDNAAVICRNNAPLFSLAFRLLREGRGVKLVGFDIGPNLVRALKKLGDERMTQTEVLIAIDRWEAEKLLKKKGEASTRDKAECLRVFASFGSTLGEAIAYAEGLFIPSAYAVSDEDLEQEQNVRYVIETRAKESLYLIDSRDYGKEEDDGVA